MKSAKKPKVKKLKLTPYSFVGIPKHALIEVLWIDAFGSAGWEVENANPVPPIIASVGYFVQTTPDGIVFASGIPNNDSGQILAPSFVPTGMIRGIRRLK